MRWLLKAAGLPLALVPTVGLPLVLVAAADGGRSPAEDAYRALPELPAEAPADSVEDLEAAAVELAASLRAVPLDAAAEQACPAERLAVSWQEPGESYQWGAHVDPIGPAPGSATTAVNGVVLCQGAGYAFMGFEAWRADGKWQLAAVPYVREEGEAHHDEESGQPDEAPPHDHAPAPAPPAPAAPAKPATPPQLSLELPSGTIEGYAAYEPQRLCDPGPKPGTLALRNLLLGANPGTRNLGISRSCGVGGQSEHKEGRALDWGVLVSRPAERAAADRFVGQLMAADAQGNPHALARRMGVMYVIWNRQIWSAYRPAAGWRTYDGPSPHTDHVHISLSWAGAMGRTSFWSGKVDPATLLAHQPVPASGGSAGSGGTGSGGGTGTHRPIPASLPTEAVRDAVKERRKDRRGDHVTEPRPEAEAERRAGRDERRQERFDERAERRALRAAERAKRHVEEAAREAERQEAERQDRERQAAEADASAEATAPRHRAEDRPRDTGWGKGSGQAQAERQAERQRKAEVKAERRQERKAEADGKRGGKGQGKAKGEAKSKGDAKGKGQGKGKERD